MRLWERLTQAVNNWSSRITFIQLLPWSGIVSVGVISALVASFTAWVDSYGALGWWFAGLIGAACASLVVLILAAVRYLWVRSNVMRRWQEQVTTINPCFRNLKVRGSRSLTWLIPSPRTSQKKTFIDCEIFGSANLAVSHA